MVLLLLASATLDGHCATRHGLRCRPFSSRQIIYSLNQLHYEGQQALFAQVAKGLEERVSYGERLIGIYNRDPGKALDRLIALLPEDDYQKPTEPFSLSVPTLAKALPHNC